MIAFLRKKYKPISFIWGLAEGTIFFISPDVFISFVSLWSLKKGFVAVLWSLLGSMAAAILLFTISPSIEINKFLFAIPLVSESLVQSAIGNLQEHGAYGVVYGAPTGTPFKIYSLYAPTLNISLLPFLFFAAISRVLRFVFVAIIAFFVGKIFKKLLSLSDRGMFVGHIIFWVCFYAMYYYYVIV